MSLHPVPSYRLSISALSFGRRLLLIGFSIVPVFPMMIADLGHLHSTDPGSFFIAMLLGAICSIPAHEALHGLVFWLCTRRVSFGFKPWTALGPVFYAASVGSRFSRHQYQLACVAPQFLTILICVLLATTRLPDTAFVGMAYAAALNLGGGVVDLLVFAILFRFPSEAEVEDSKIGMDVYLQLPAD